MKSFQELREATTGRAGVKCSGEKSQFGGYTPTCTRNGKGVYSAQQSYKDADTAKKHAEVYADAYYAYGDRPAQKAVRDFVAKNKSKLHTKKESVDERKELTYRIHKDGKPLKKGGKTVEIYGVAKAKKMVDDLNKKHRGSKFTAHHVYKDGDDLDEGKLPPHLSKFFDKKGNLNKDAEERVKKGRKKRGLDPYTGKKLKTVKESADTYFDSYSSAIRHALGQAKKKGYEVDEDDVFREITTGQGKPGRGKTVRHTLKLTKGGKAQRKALHIQVYNRETNKKTFELNSYIS